MKKIITILLVFLVLLPNLGNVVVYFSFKINQEEISRTLCLQKDFIYNTCNGRCVLETKLKKIEDTQKSVETNIKEKSELVFTFFATIVENASFVFNKQNKEKDFFNPSLYCDTFINSIFHPPTV